MVADACALSAKNNVPQAQTSDNSICVDPFCTYAPPKLTGKGMAEAAREIMRAGRINYKLIPYSDKQKGLQEAQLFLNRNHVAFVDPLLIAASVGDLQLRKMFSTPCIDKLSHFQVLGLNATGPFFVYQFNAPSGDKQKRYTAVAVFGRADTPSISAESYAHRVQAERSSGVVRVLTPGTQCDFLESLPLQTREARRVSKHKYMPRLAGMGYQNGRPFFYELVSVDSNHTLYVFQLQMPRLETTTQTLNVYRAYITDLQPDFDPFTIVNKQEKLP